MVPIKDLKEADLFKTLNTKQLQPFRKHFAEENFVTGEVIFLQGEHAKNLYILLEGEVTLDVKAKGEFGITAELIQKKGEAFGLPSLMKPYRNSVSATCNRRTRVLSVNAEVLRRLMKQNTNVGIVIMERVAEIFSSRLNSNRALITNLFKMFRVQTGKSKLMEAYHEK
jgi:CRP-like cAMP-binding protein